LNITIAYIGQNYTLDAERFAVKFLILYKEFDSIVREIPNYYQAGFEFDGSKRL